MFLNSGQLFANFEYNKHVKSACTSPFNIQYDFKCEVGHRGVVDLGEMFEPGMMEEPGMVDISSLPVYHPEQKREPSEKFKESQYEPGAAPSAPSAPLINKVKNDVIHDAFYPMREMMKVPLLLLDTLFF